MTDGKAIEATQSRNGMAAFAQDRAAGGGDFRKMRTRTGEIVTVSLAVSDVAGGTRVILRFKSGGATVQRPVGTVKAATRFDALKLGWQMIRTEKIVEKEAWSWVATAP
jgi:hypothetical protein